MSTADSQLLVCSSSVSADIYQDIFKPEATDKEVLNVGRITTIVVAALAFIIAWNPNSSVMALVSDAWAGLGSAFGPLVVMSLFWKRTNPVSYTHLGKCICHNLIFRIVFWKLVKIFFFKINLCNTGR